MIWILTATIGLLLAFANGANDGMKGVATLIGSGTSSFRRSRAFAVLTTALGSICALVLARGLIAAFTGAGLVPPETIADPVFPLSVALGAALTVLLATRVGLPVSTTHALVGGLCGAGLASSSGIDAGALGGKFLMPLLTSPLLAILGAALAYRFFRSMRLRLGVEQETCVCVGEEVVGVVAGNPSCAQAVALVRHPALRVGTEASCRVRYSGRVLGVSARGLLDLAHFLSAGVVSFARGLNDTPKIAALLLVGQAVAPGSAIGGVALAMAFGAWIASRRVAETMAERVTEMNPGQGFAGNLVTGLLVVGASRLGMPVSTTHVSCGALFGIGAVTRRARWNTILRILLAWVVTLPVAAALAALLASTLPALLTL